MQGMHSHQAFSAASQMHICDFVKAVPKRGCHVVCFVHGIYLYQVICEDAGYQSLELWGECKLLRN